MSKIKKILAITVVITSISIPVFASIQEGRVIVKSSQGYDYHSYAYVTQNTSGKNVSGNSRCTTYHEKIKQVSSKAGNTSTRYHRDNAISYGVNSHPNATTLVTNGAQDPGGWAYHSQTK